MTVKLVTDSTCNLPPHLMALYDIHVAPVTIRFGMDTYKADVDIDTAEFYRKIAAGGILPQTSQPSTGEFAHLYNTLADEGADEIISVHVAARLSGTYQSAALAAAQVSKRVRVYVVDSMAGSAPIGWMLVDAAKLIAQGRPAAEIVAHLEAQKTQTTIFFAVDNLKFAQMSGRVGRLTGVLSAMLNIKPVIGLEGGQINVLTKVRSNKAAMQQIVALTKERVKNNPLNVGVVHAQTPQRAKTLLKLAKAELNIQQAFIAEIRISLAVHFGPGTLGLTTYPFQGDVNAL